MPSTNTEISLIPRNDLERKPSYLLRPFEVRDIDLIWHWYQTPFMRGVEEIKNVSLSKDQLFLALSKLIPLSQLQMILVDNIRVGIIWKYDGTSYICLSSIAFSFGYLSKNDLEILGIISSQKATLEFLLAYQKLYDKSDYSNISPTPMSAEGALITRKSKNILFLGPCGRNKKKIKYLIDRGHSVHRLENKITCAETTELKIDFIISSGYAYKVPNEVVVKFKDSIINLHATFLPWGKGIGTIFYSFLLGQPVGVSIHLIDIQFDTGPIVCRKIVEPSSEDTTRTHYLALMLALEEIFFETWPIIESGNFQTTNQLEIKHRPPYFSRLDFEKIIERLPKGYDTTLEELAVLREVNTSSLNFFNKLEEQNI
jgi:folate-dependent phosphoribosylglycinamide formyltransferase PurN